MDVALRRRFLECLTLDLALAPKSLEACGGTRWDVIATNWAPKAAPARWRRENPRVNIRGNNSGFEIRGLVPVA